MRKIGLLIYVIFGFCYIANAQSDQFKKVDHPVELIDLLQQKTSGVNSIESSFTQHKHLSFLEDDVVSKGKFVFKKPNKVKWEYLTPASYRIICNNEQMVIDDGVKKQIFYEKDNQWFSYMNKMMSGFMTGKVFDMDDAFDSQYFRHDNLVKVELLPKNPLVKEYLKSVWVFFDLNKDFVTVLQLNEIGQDYTKIIFEGQVYNQKVDEKSFMDQ
ncbi:outer membrane lipoprotein carrier protein LolA [Persicobacter psychrovividus]